MKLLCIGRSEWLYNTILELKNTHEVIGIISARESKEYKVKEEDFQQLSEEIGVPYFKSSFSNKIELKDFVKELGEFDLGLSVNHPFILDQEILDNANICFLNAHGGDLPRYRGNACQAWAIINGEEQIGLCVHKMNGGELDSGDIISRSYLPINLTTKIEQVYNWFETEIPILFKEACLELSNNSEFILESQVDSKAKPLRCFPRSPEDGKIDWNSNAVDIIRLVNASGRPYRGAFCFYNDKQIFVYRAELYEKTFDYLAIPGQICEIHQEYIVVAANDDLLKISQLFLKTEERLELNSFKSVRARLY